MTSESMAILLHWLGLYSVKQAGSGRKINDMSQIIIIIISKIIIINNNMSICKAHISRADYEVLS